MMSESPSPQRSFKRPFFLVLHWIILLNFLFEIFYAGYMVFFVVRPEGPPGPLYAAAKAIPFEMMVTRRLYAIEFWIAFAGLALYLALTEFRGIFDQEKK